MMTNLIYDRTSEDVAEVRRLLAKLDPETGDGLTAAEQAKWDRAQRCLQFHRPQPRRIRSKNPRRRADVGGVSGFGDAGA